MSAPDSPLPDSADTRTITRITNPRLLLALRAAWLIVVSLMVIVVIAGTPAAYQFFSRHFFPKLYANVNLADFGLSIQFVTAFHTVIQSIVFLVSLAVGMYLFWKRSDDWMAMLTALVFVVNGFVFNTSALGLRAEQPGLRWLVILLGAVSFVSAYLFILLFPDGRAVPRWMRWLIPPSILWGVFVSTIIFDPEVYDAMSVGLILIGSAAFFGIGIVGQVYRFRRTTSPVQRQQTKWVVLGLVGDIILLSLGSIVQIALSIGRFDALTLIFLDLVVFPLSYYGVALLGEVVVTFSILRYRLWDVDLVINRSLVYGGLTLVLGAVFLAGLFLLQSVLGAVLGGEQATTAAIISTGVIVALFNPARRRLQNIVDRRFYGLRLDLNQLAELQKPKVIPNPGALTGATLGAYQVLELIGRGGMGEVYKGYQTELERAVAIKVLPPELAQNAEFLARFEREAKVVANLRHPNIVGIFDYGNVNGIHYMVMEFVSGQTLSDYLHNHKVMRPDEALPILGDIAGALDYAHEQGLVHRDVKPSNVMLQKITATGTHAAGQRAVLMDFGITKLIGAVSGLTHTGGAMGTLDYMAPEQIMSAKEVDLRADIYSLGVTVYQILTGQLPFRGNSVGQLLFAHLQQPPPNPCNLNQAIPSKVAQAVMQAMAKKPEDRFQSAGEFVAALA